MEYRKLPHGGEQISVIGLGNSSLSAEVGEKEIQATVEMALENGVNYFDMAAGDSAPFMAYGQHRQNAGFIQCVLDALVLCQRLVEGRSFLL